MIEVAPYILGGPRNLPHMNEFVLEDLLHSHKIDIRTNTKIVSATKEKVVVSYQDRQMDIPADTLISAVGYKENHKLYNELKNLNIPVYNIGDSAKVNNIMCAIWNAYEVARNI